MVAKYTGKGFGVSVKFKKDKLAKRVSNRRGTARSTNKRVINFKCDLECGGKCCIGNTQLLASEFEKVINDVPIVPMIVAIPVSVLSSKIGEINPSYKKKILEYAFVVNTSEDGDFAIFLDFIMGSTTSNIACPYLKDGLCSIYDERPLRCKLYPIHPLLPEIMMELPLEKLRNTDCTAFLTPEKTEFSVWEDGKLSRKEDRDDIDKYFIEISKHKPFLDTLLRLEEGSLEKDGNIDFGVVRLIQRLVGELAESKDTAFMLSGEFPMPYLSTKILRTLLPEEVSSKFVDAQYEAHKKFREYDPEGWESNNVMKRQMHFIEKQLKREGKL